MLPAELRQSGSAGGSAVVHPLGAAVQRVVGMFLPVSPAAVSRVAALLGDGPAALEQCEVAVVGVAALACHHLHHSDGVEISDPAGLEVQSLS